MAKPTPRRSVVVNSQRNVRKKEPSVTSGSSSAFTVGLLHALYALKGKVVGKKQLASDRVQNPQDPEATYAAKGQGEKKKEHVGYKVQVAETVCEAILAPGEASRRRSRARWMWARLRPSM